jgi:hypothetical protein
MAKRSRQVAELLQCAICTEVWTSPQTLQCGHTFCSGCLVLVDKCGICRASIETKSITCYALRELAGTVEGLTEEEKKNLMKDGRAKLPKVEAPTAEDMIEYAKRMDEKVAQEAAQHVLTHHLKAEIDKGQTWCTDICGCNPHQYGYGHKTLFSLPAQRQTRAVAILRAKGYKVEHMGVEKKVKGVKTFVPTEYSISLT